MQRLLTHLLLTLVMFQTFMPAGFAQIQRNENVTFRFDAGISAEDQSYIREGIHLARMYVLEHLNETVDGPLIVNARPTSAPISLGEVAEATDGYIAFFTRSPGWFQSSPAYRVETVVHEFIHIYQRAALDDSAPGVPLWMIEGTAEFLASDALISRDIISQSDADAYRYWSIVDADLAELVEYELQSAFRQADARVYALAYLGMAHLARENGVASIGAFFEDIGDGADWEDAFADAFGISPRAFYGAFEKERADFIRPVSSPDSFAEVDPVDTASPVRVTDAPESIAPGDQLLMKGRSEPNARCIAYLWGESLDLAHETTADAGGDLFWLVTIPIDTPVQTAELSIDCGSGPVVIDIEIER